MSQPTNAIRNSIDSIGNPEVMMMIEKLSEYGLAVSVPHMHDKNGSFEELPSGVVSLEEDLNVSFKQESEINDEESIPVMWRWNKKEKKLEVTARCGLECRL